MDQQATNLLTVLRDANAPVETKLDLIDKLKSHIKHHIVPENAIAPTFDVIRLSLTFSQLQDAAFSVLSHMTKRMTLQHQHNLLVQEGSKTYPIVLERLGDTRDRVQARAIQCLSEFWKVSGQEVEALIRDQALSSPRPRVRKAAAQWVGRTHRDQNLPFKTFVPKLVQCAADADSATSEVARSVLIELFRNAPDAAKADLQRQLSRSSVPANIADGMLTQVGHKTSSSASKGSPSATRVQPEKTATSATSSKPPSTSHSATNSRDMGTTRTKRPGPVPPGLDSADALPPPVAPSTKADLDPSKPIDVRPPGQFTLSKHLTIDNKDRVVRLDELFREFQPIFDGKETEQNWGSRDKHIIALRKLNKGNAPSDHHAVFLAQIKLFRDGILKVVNSLRTTPSTNACFLIQELARTFGSHLDPLVEFFMDTLIKLCGHTKVISAQNANQTISTLFNNVSYTKNLLLHISNASGDKNSRPRLYAQGWLKAVIGRHINHKHILEHGNGVDTLEKILRKGLADQDPGVRESARDAYWSFNPLWPNRGEAHQNQLLQHASNPDKSQAATQVGGSSRSVFSKSTTAATRTSVKEAVLAKKREKERFERPASAQASTSPTRNPSRPQSSLATGTLSSAPLRPARPKSAMKRAESPKAPTKSVVKKPSSRSPLKGPSPTKAAEDLTVIVPSASLGPPADLGPRPKTSDSTSSTTKSFDIASEQGGITPTADRPRSHHGRELGSQSAGRPVPNPGLNMGAMSLSTPEANKSPRSDRTDPVASSPTPARSPPKNLLHSPMRTETLTIGDEQPLEEVSRPPSVLVRDEGSPRAAVEDEETTSIASSAKESSPAEMANTDGARDRALAELSESQTNNANDHNDTKTVRLIDSGIKRISSKTLDAHGFRKLQSTINANVDLLSAEKMDELLRAVIPRIGDDVSPADDRVLTQQLLLLKTLAHCKQSGSAKYVPESLTNILMAMGRYEEQSRTQVTLESTFADLTGLADFPATPAVAAVRELAERLSSAEDARTQRTLSHAYDALGQLLAVPAAQVDGSSLPHEVLPTALQGIRHHDASIRKKAYNLAAAVFRALPDPAPFWTAVEALPTADQAMLHYVVEK